MQPFCTHFSTRTQESVPKVFSLTFLRHPKGWHLPAHAFCEELVNVSVYKISALNENYYKLLRYIHE